MKVLNMYNSGSIQMCLFIYVYLFVDMNMYKNINLYIFKFINVKIHLESIFDWLYKLFSYEKKCICTNM